jgi:hypothetical protein
MVTTAVKNAISTDTVAIATSQVIAFVAPNPDTEWMKATYWKMQEDIKSMFST